MRCSKTLTQVPALLLFTLPPSKKLYFDAFKGTSGYVFLVAVGVSTGSQMFKDLNLGSRISVPQILQKITENCITVLMEEQMGINFG